jgi:glyoxylase-like metal-dependent hydrolase (beta-lactamase superfamily II)
MIRKIHLIETGFLKLDGGAMFGVVPKRMWSKLNPPDENNMCTWSMRCLLLETEDRVILVDTGMGSKQDDKFKSFFYPHGEANLLSSIAQKGFTPEEITDVFLTHLHFDHCGEAVSKNAEGKLYPTFPNARYWSNEKHWNWAMNPNDREKASFLKENFVPLQKDKVLKFIESPSDYFEWIPGIHIHICNGHTEAMMALEIECNGEHYFYPADLIPSSHHVASPFIMAYDIRPLLTLSEKEKFLTKVIQKKGMLILEHDPAFTSCSVKYSDTGRIVVNEYLNNNKVINI